MKWNKKLDKYIVNKNKSMNEQRNLLQQEDKLLLWATIVAGSFFIGLGLIYLLLK